jgi:hypothetical protein
VRHSLLFAVGGGPPHDGVRKARRPNLSYDLAGQAHRFETLNEIASPIVPTGTIRFTRSGDASCCAPRSGRGEAGFLAEAELGLIALYAVKDDGELAGHGDTGAGHASSLGDRHAPGSQAGPLRLRTSSVWAAS